MNKKLFIAFLVAALAIPGCGNASNSDTTAAEETSFAPISVTTAYSRGSTAEDYTTSEDDVDISDLPIDPDYDFDVDTMKASDFGGAFSNTYSSTTDSYTILPGDECENTVTVIKGETDGPTVYVIAGIHGDEEAAWQAGKLLRQISIKAGTLYVIHAPILATAKAHVRKIEGKDPNRVWPGDPDGTAAERVAYALFNDVKEKNPDFVLDLHEARIVRNDGDCLGSSIIYTDLDLFPGDLFFDFMSDTEAGLVCSHKFHSDSPSPDGSLNYTISTELKIPTMTVETFRGYQMDNRISDQLAVVEYVLQYYGMVD